jgi:hypothetical protein
VIGRDVPHADIIAKYNQNVRFCLLSERWYSASCYDENSQYG